MPDLTGEQLAQCVIAGLRPDRARALVRPLNAALHEFGIDTRLRVAAFLSQVAHESGGFRYSEEIWGPTPAQVRYEGRKDLGNTEPGDGRRYRGRGWIQLTGRANYRKYGALLGLDLVNHPELAANADQAFRIAGAFWRENRINEPADDGDLAAVTRRVNGGLNGLLARKAYYDQALRVLPVGWVLGVETAPRVLVGPREVDCGPYLTEQGTLGCNRLAEVLRELGHTATWDHETKTLKVER